jgi:tRNA modification GTPase
MYTDPVEFPTSGSRAIFALATPPGAGLAALVRVSGDGVPGLAALLGVTPWRRGAFELGLDLPVGRAPCLAWAMPAPRTLTGEHTLELIVPGNRHVLQDLEQRLHGLGAREAEPGEFTRRALQAGNLDLSRAEATLALINAQDEATRRQALSDLSGESADRVAELAESLRALGARYEMLFDFSEEEHAEPVEHALRADLAAVTADLREFAGTRPADTSRHAPVVALFGPPNAGKSSLFNALLGVPRSTVSEHPGTTRDPVAQPCTFGPHAAELVDLSGVGESDADLGRFAGRAGSVAANADLLLALEPPGDSDARARFEQLCRQDPGLRARAIRVFTKSDLGATPVASDLESCAVSAVSGAGLDELRRRVEARLKEIAVGGVTSRLRGACRDALELLAAVDDDTPPEAAAGEVRRALTALDQGLLHDAPGDVLDHIFSRFCIGK